VPVFPNRVFRHSCVFINRHAGITGPQDLTGKTIGEFGVYGQDSGVWAKCILADDYGFPPGSQPVDRGRPRRPVRAVRLRPAGPPGRHRHRRCPGGPVTGPDAESGEIDALFTANVPQSLMDGTSKNIVRLFPDYEAVERDYYQRTGSTR
jgi:hypothetical protein